MGHTPGPWAVGCLSSNDGEAEVISNADGSKTICWTADTYSEDEDAGIVTSEDFANGRLIAAAPELLAALKVALSYADMEMHHETVDEYYALIAKAEGRSE